MFWLAVEDRDGKWRIAKQLPCANGHKNPKTGQYHQRKVFYYHDQVAWFSPLKSIWVKSYKVVTADTKEEACHSL